MHVAFLHTVPLYPTELIEWGGKGGDGRVSSRGEGVNPLKCPFLLLLLNDDHLLRGMHQMYRIYWSRKYYCTSDLSIGFPPPSLPVPPPSPSQSPSSHLTGISIPLHQAHPWPGLGHRPSDRGYLWRCPPFPPCHA